MTREEFKLIARLLKSKEPVITAVGLVLFDDMANAQAARSVGCTPQAVHRSTKRFLSLHKEIRDAFKKSLE
jgi:hypothetical protein